MTYERCRQLHEEQEKALESRLSLGATDRRNLREEIETMKKWNRSLTGTFILTILAVTAYLLVNGTFAKTSDLAQAERNISEIKSDIKVIKVSQEYQEKALNEVSAIMKEIRNGRR